MSMKVGVITVWSAEKIIFLYIGNAIGRLSKAI